MDGNFAEDLRQLLGESEEQLTSLGYKRDDIEEVISNIEDANATLENALNYIDEAVDSATRLTDEYIPQAQDLTGYQNLCMDKVVRQLY